jgi:hypothetical protein
MVTALVLLWWLPATNHCRLEQVPTLSFFVCCDHDEAAPHQDDDCDTDGCATVESASYKTEDAKIVTLIPLTVVVLDWAWVAEPLPPEDARTFRPAAPPPELPRIWQFSRRAAAPARAPSLTS